VFMQQLCLLISCILY